MRYEESVFLTKKETETTRKALAVEPKCGKDCFGEDETFSRTAVFPDGKQVDVKMCGVRFDPCASSNLPWTEAVLFDSNGAEIRRSDPRDAFEGDWELEADGNVYCALVVPFDESFGN